MSRIKISKPERLPRDGITDIDLNTWKNELLNYLSQDDNFEKFSDDGPYSTWEASETSKHRILNAVLPDTELDLAKRRKQLNNFITITAGCCYKDHYMTVIEQSTSFEWIFNELKNIYQIVHVGKDFLNIVDIRFDASTMSATSVYNAYRSKIMENLKPKGTKVKWKNNFMMQSQEALTPTFEDHILLSVLQLIDSRLPLKVREVYGPRMEDNKFLMDFKQDILTNVSKMLEDMESVETQLSWMQFNKAKNPSRFTKSKQNYGQNKQSGGKFCRLCHLTRKSRNQVTSHEIGDLDCPSLSSKDKTALEQKIGRLAPVVTPKDDLEELAMLHGYGTESAEADEYEPTQENVIFNSKISYINPVPSQILTLFQENKIVHIDLDSGCWVSCAKLEFVKKMKWKILPNSQLAKLADDKTILKSVGEINETFSRNNWRVNYRALVITELHTDVIGGNNFFKDNNIEQSIVNKTITVHNKFVVPETNRNVKLPSQINNILVSAVMPQVLLQNQSVSVKVPLEDGKQIIVEPRIENSMKHWPTPQLCLVKNGTVEINNMSNKPVHLKGKEHQLQIISTNEQSTSIKPSEDYERSQDTQGLNQFKVEDLEINYKILNNAQKSKLLHNIQNCKEIFNKDLTGGYNQSSGKHYCNLNWANQEKPISRKVICPNYNTNLNYLLQEVCDELTNAGVLGVPQEDGVIIQHVSPCFLRKKQKAKDKSPNQLKPSDVRLVVNTTELSKYLKNIPTKVTKPNEVYAALSKWKYIIKSDLYQGFFQNKLHHSAYPWCAIQTPYGGMRYFKRSIQGLVGQTEEQDELLSKILHEHLKNGRCVKIADDIFAGGNDIDEAIDNWSLIMETLHKNNMKISPEKTVIFPSIVDILSWQWKEGGYLTPSPHRKLALENIKYEDLKTVKDIRSWIGLYKTFIDCTPNLTIYLDKFDQFVGSRDSKDEIKWTEDYIKAFKHAQEQISNMKDLYLPNKHDQLIIMCDGARTPPAVGMVLQAKTPQGDVKVVKYYSVKLKPHMVKWYPCELEAVALGASIEAFYEFIKQSEKPVIICPDSKPVVDAARKIEKGNFSLSPRIQTFLNGLSKINYEIQHISGKSGHNAAGDFQSRNAFVCKTEHCQICTFIRETAETIIDVKLNNISTSANEKSMMSFLNRNAWINIQEKDAACKQAIKCLQTGQGPSKKPGKMFNNVRKYVSKGTVAKDGLLIVHGNIPMTTNKTERIVIPSEFVETIVTQVHLKFHHPAKSQLVNIINRYFFATGTLSVIDNLYLNCQLCQAAMKIPKAFQEHTNTTTAEHPGTHFGIDVMKRAKQKIIVARDMFSSFVTAIFIEKEDKESLRSALINLIQPIRSMEQVIVRTDNATGFQSLATKDDKLTNLNIKIELSDPHNKNGNTCVDKAISELITEITKLQPSEVPIDHSILAKAVMNLNSRIRRKGNLSASEILFCRDQVNKVNLYIDDKKISQDQMLTRDNANSKHNQSNPSTDIFHKGDLVQMKANPQKHNVRETFLVTESSGNDLKAQKLTNVFSSKKSQLRAKEYVFKPGNIFRVLKENQKSLLQDDIYQNNTKTRNCTSSNWSPIRRTTADSSTDISESESEEIEAEQPLRLSSDDEFITGTDDQTNSLTEDELSNSISEQNIEQQTMEQEIDHDDTISNDGNIEADEDTDTQTGTIQKKKIIRKKFKETWSLEKPQNHRPPRKARTECLKKLSSLNSPLEKLRDSSTNSCNEAILSAATEHTRIRIETSDSEIEEPIDSSDWDKNDLSGTPSYFNNAYCEPVFNFLELAPTEIPSTINPGRVYDLSNLPVPQPFLNTEPLALTSYNQKLQDGRVYDLSLLPSPPSLEMNRHSTPRKYTKATGKLTRLRKRLFKH